MATDYEQKYKEALERARKLYNDAKANEYKSDMEDYESIFPELKEIEDEWMLQTIIRGFENWKSNGKVTFNYAKVDDILAYLEKQKEQKPAEWSEEDEEMFEAVDESLYCYESGKAQEVVAQIEAERRWFYSLLERFNLQPKQEWSEEEKEILDSILSHYVLIDKPTDANGIPKEKYISLIKSIRFDTYKNCNSHWKPSEEQDSVAERFARIIRGNLIGIDKEVQQKFENLYFEVTGNKMYGGYND